MRSGLLLAVFVGLALASIDEDAFRKNNRYQYRYEAQLVTGSQQESKEWSGLRLTAVLEVYFTADIKVVAQLTKVNLQKFDKFVEDRTPAFFMQPEELLLDGVEADVQNMIEQLQTPFGFNWNKGYISQVSMANQEPLWSANIKRGVIGLFEVNLNKRQLIGSPSQSSQSDSIAFNPFGPSYTVWEEGTYGNCRTTYTPKPESRSPTQFYLTKVRDYDSCLQTPYMAYSFNNFGYEQLNKSDKHIDVASEISYAIKGDKSGFLILTAVGESKIFLKPYGSQEGQVQTSMNQTMYLLDQQPFLEGGAPQCPQKKYSLRMDLPIETIQDLQPYTLFKRSEVQARPYWSLNKMDQLLSWIANGTLEYPSSEVMMYTQQLMEAIRYSRIQELKNLLSLVMNQQDRMGSQEAGELKLKIYWELLSTAGTTSASEVLLEFCLNNYHGWVPAERMGQAEQKTYNKKRDQCLQAFTSIGLYSPPSEQILTKMIEMNKRTQAQPQGDEEMHMVTLLATGSVMGRAVDIFQQLNKTINERIQHIQQLQDLGTLEGGEDQAKYAVKALGDRIDEIKTKHQELKEKFLQEVKKRLTKDSREQDTILALKALRNAHCHDSQHTLLNILQDTLLRPSVRIAAAQAFEKFQKNKLEVIRVLEEVLKNPQELASVRIQAFRTIINLGPPVETLVRLAGSMRYNKDRQLSTYVWSVYNHLSNSTFLPYRQVASNMTSAKQFISPVSYGMQDSHYSQCSHELKNGAGAASEYSMISTPDFVDQAETAFYLSMFGTTNKALQLSVLTEGLQQVMKKMMGPKGFFTDKNSLFDLFKRTKRSTDVKSKIAEIFQKLSVKAREIPEVRSYFQMQMMNSVVRFYDLSSMLRKIIDLDEVEANINEQKLEAGIVFSYKSSGIMSQFHMQLATEAGFPINLNLGLTYSANVKGEINGGVDASIYKVTRGYRAPVDVKMGLYINPQIVASLSGKMSIDGYIFQAGALISATANIKAPFTLNATIDLLHNRLSTSLSPPVNTEMPVLRFEVKPYVFSRAMAGDINAQQPLVNRRPFFCTMQPIIINNGAHIHQFSKSLGKTILGYDIRAEGQYPWSPQAQQQSLLPLTAQSYYALWINAENTAPAALRADIRWFNQPRHSSPARREGDISPSAAEQVAAEDASQGLPTGPLPDYPDLRSNINFQAIKNKIEERIGHGIPIVATNYQWGFIAVLDSSRLSEDGQTLSARRTAVVQGIVQAWKEGQFHQAYLSVLRSAIPEYSAQEWKMTLKSSAIFPPKRLHVRDLVDPAHQTRVYQDMMQMLQRQEHRVTNKNFAQQLFTKIGQYSMKHLPSMDPEIILDRTLPEFILDNKQSEVIRARLILKTLLPLSDQLRELKSELIDAFKVSEKQELIKELGKKIALDQVKVMKLLRKVGKQPFVQRGVITAAEYLVYKLTECVVDFDEVVERGLNLRLFNKQQEMNKLKTKVDKQQMGVYRFSRAALSSRPTYNADKIKQIAANARRQPGAYGDSYEPLNLNDERRSSPVLQALTNLTTEQLSDIMSVWYSISNDRAVKKNVIQDLVQQAVRSMDAVDDFVKQNLDVNNRELTQLIFQATLQHQILGKLMHVARFNVDNRIKNQEETFERYALKVQTKQLLERAYFLELQHKVNQTCMTVDISEQEMQIMRDIKVLDTKLLTMQRDGFLLPRKEYPWSDNLDTLTAAQNRLQEVLHEMKAARDQLIALPGMPSPCATFKFMFSATHLQKKMAIFKKTIVAQYQTPAELIEQQDKLDSQYLDMMVNLSPLFNKYINNQNEGQADLFPQGNVLISAGVLEVSMIHNKQSRVFQQLRKYLFQFGSPPFRVIKNILQTAADQTQELLGELETQAERVKLSMEQSSSLVAYSMYAQFMQILQQQNDIYDILQQQLNIWARKPDLPRIQPQLQAGREKIAHLIEDAGLWKLPGGHSDSPALMADSLIANTGNYFDQSSYDNLDAMSYMPWGMDSQEQKEHNEPMFTDNLQDNNVPSVIGGKGIIMNINITYGNDTYLGAQIHGLRSVEQLMWQALQFYPAGRDSCVARAIESDVSGREKLEKCGEDMDSRLNSFNHVHFALTSNTRKLPSYLENAVKKMMGLIRHKFWDRTDTEQPQDFVMPGTVQGILDFSVDMNSVDMYMMTRNETMSVLSAPLPCCIKSWYPFQNLKPLTRKALNAYTNKLMPAMCKVDRSNVKTIDGAVYSLPRLHSNCRTLLAMDCSSDMTFAVNLQPVARGPGQILQILAEEHEVKIQPEFISDRVMVDGKDIALKFGKPYIITKELAYGQQEMAIVITRQHGGYVRVEYPLVGLDILFDFTFINMEMSSVYKNQVCGACGNFDLQMTKELEGPKRTLFTSPDDFFRAYVIPDQSCPAKNAVALETDAAAADLPVNQPGVQDTRYHKRPSFVAQEPRNPLAQSQDLDDDFEEEFSA